MDNTPPYHIRHPELVSGSIPRFTRSQRRQAQPNGKVSPVQVLLLDQIDLPRSVPVLELLLARDRGDHVAIDFEMNQAVDFVTPGKSRQRIIAMLPKPTDQIRGYAHIKRAVVPARKDVDARKAFLPHGAESGARWTLKQVQGDEFGSKWSFHRPRPLPFHRHAELVSASIVRHFRSAEL